MPVNPNSAKRIDFSASDIFHSGKRVICVEEIASKNLPHFQLLTDSKYFDPEFYLSTYTDVAKSTMDPVIHYLMYGAIELRDPSHLFSTNFYLSRYTDVAQSQINPLVHFLLFGENEGRLPKPSRIPFNQNFKDSIFNHRVEKKLLEQRPLISVVMPCKNRHELLLNALNSISSQTYTNWEVIIVDDHSMPRLHTVLKNLLLDPRFILVENNLAGASAARNYGISKASGKYITYLDSDNTWEPEYLEYVVRTFLNFSCPALYSNFSLVQDGETVFIYDYDYNHDLLKVSNYIDINAFAHIHFRDKFKFSTDLKRFIDWDFILQIAAEFPILHAEFNCTNYNTNASDRISAKESNNYGRLVINNHLFNWSELEKHCSDRNPNIMSIIVLHFGDVTVTNRCLDSIFQNSTDTEFEIVLVDNDDSVESRECLEYWTTRFPNVSSITASVNFGFALGCNLGFSVSKGEEVVFLNNDTIVTSGWLSSLSKNLKNREILGVQPKLLFEDGVIQNFGIAFNHCSKLPFPLFKGFAGTHEATMRPVKLKAITGACAAFRAKDFVSNKGFDALFVNGMEDVDFCLRLGKGEARFLVEPDAIVIHSELKSAARAEMHLQNRQEFIDRYRNLELTDDISNFILSESPITFEMNGYVGGGRDLQQFVYKGDLRRNKRPLTYHLALGTFEIAIKISCPNEQESKYWGDYHYAAAIQKAFARIGIRSRIDFKDNWAFSLPTDINLVIIGISKFEPVQDRINLAWVISHPEKISITNIQKYDLIFSATSSKKLPWVNSCENKFIYLPQATDISRFYPREKQDEFSSKNLYVGNSRRVFRWIPKKALRENFPLDIHGRDWNEFMPSEYLKSDHIPNYILPDFYSNSEVVINDTWDDMKKYGITSNRLFDVLACDGCLLSDSWKNTPTELRPFANFILSKVIPLSLWVRLAKKRHKTKSGKSSASEIIKSQHSMDCRIQVIAKEVVTRLILT